MRIKALAGSLLCALAVFVNVAPAAAHHTRSTAELRAVLAHDVGLIHRYTGTQRFFGTHPALAGTAPGRRALAHAAATVRWRLRAAETVRGLLAPPWPPDHALWICIQSHEASWHSRAGVTDTSQHYGGLQMTWNWMRIINGNAGDYPQRVQEWAAHRAWVANGRSYSFLVQQWYAWDDADGCGTTG